MMKLKLQLFAENTQTTQSSGLSAEMKTFYEKRLLDIAEPKLMHGRFGDSYPIPQNSGNQIEFRKYAMLGKALTPLTEGVTPDGNSLHVTSMTCQLKQYGDWVQMSDLFQETAVDNNVVQTTKLLGSQAGRTLDTVMREELCGGTNVMYAPKIVNGAAQEVTSRAGLDKTAVLTPELFFKAAAQLAAMNADYIDDSYVAIIHPYAAYDLMRNSEWLDVHKYADPSAIYNGEIGKLGNVRFVSSTEAKIWQDETCPAGLGVFATLVLGAHAYGSTSIEGGGLQHIVKQLGYGNDPLNQRSSCGWKATMAVKRLVEEYMIRIESCSAYSSQVKAN